MTKLTDLKGSENLPKKEPIHRCYCEGDNGCDITCRELKSAVNDKVDEYNSLSIDGDVEALAQLIAKERYASIEFGREYAKFIIPNLDKFLVIRKG